MACLVEFSGSGSGSGSVRGGAGPGGFLGGAGGAAPRGRRHRVRARTGELAHWPADFARPGRAVARAARSLNDMLAGVRPVVVEDFVNGFRDTTRRPDEFGLALPSSPPPSLPSSLSAEADVMIFPTACQVDATTALTRRRPSDRVAR